MKTIIHTGILLGVAVALSACNTIGGVGKDVSAVGKAVDKAAVKTSHEIDKAERKL